jgi:prevent-host-death family protein
MVHLPDIGSATSEVAMEDVGVRELRDHLSRWLDEVKAGRDITITERGKPVARIIPIAGDDRLAQLIAEGIVTPPKGKKADLAAWNPIKLKSGATISDLVIEERRSR